MSEKNDLKYFPWFTILFSVLLLVMYLIVAYFSQSFTINFELLDSFGAPYSTQIYLGSFYGVIFNNLIHINFFHLAINIAGLWLFGAFIERRIGTFKMAILGLMCSILGSIIQLNFSDDAGLGIAAALFGFYSFILVKSFKDQNFKNGYILKMGIILLLFLVLLLFKNQYFGETFALQAKIGGIIWGAIMALLSQHENTIQPKNLFILFIPYLFVVSTLVYAPWSSQWQSAKGIECQLNNQPQQAGKHYENALHINPKNELAKTNYIAIKVDSISQLAYHAHLKQEYTQARKYYFQILKLQKNNRWAINNLKELP